MKTSSALSSLRARRALCLKQNRATAESPTQQKSPTLKCGAFLLGHAQVHILNIEERFTVEYFRASS